MKKLVFIVACALSIGSTYAQTAPEITFKEDVYDGGMIKENGVAEHIFEYTNTGTGNLVITDVKDNCGCTKVNFATEPVGPGNTAAMIVSFTDTKTKGNQEAVLTITSNAVTANKTITYKVNVVSLKTLIPATAAPNPPGE